MLTQDLTQAVQDHLGSGSERFVIAVSGGRDSMALLHAVAHHLPRARERAAVATFNHGIRPEAAAEVDLVQSWCARHGIRCWAGAGDAPALVANGGNLEAAARELRYAFLAQVAQDWGAALIVTAHHADDQAETVLMHVLRGASLHGLVGMRVRSPHPQKPHLTLVRPLLRIPRSAIDAYVQAHDVPYIDDRSNADPDYTRNALRLNVMPLLAQLNPQVTAALARLAQLAADDLDVVEATFAREALPLIDRRATSWAILRGVFLRLPVAFQRRFIQRAHQALAGSSASFDDVERALDLIRRGRTSEVLRLTGGVTVRVVGLHGNLHVLVGELPDVWWRLYPAQQAALTMDHPVRLANGWLTLTRSLSHSPDLFVPHGAAITLRGRQRGDVFQPSGLRGHRVKLAEWMVDQKIPREVRGAIPLLVVDGQIAAVLVSPPVIAYPFMIASGSSEPLIIVLLH
jgi:tRNA(Ile)-lysidine synthetase-like protein